MNLNILFNIFLKFELMFFFYFHPNNVAILLNHCVRKIAHKDEYLIHAIFTQLSRKENIRDWKDSF